MKLKLLILVSLILIPLFANLSYAQLGWKEINTGFSGRLYDVTMTSLSNLYTCGEDGRIYLSTNYGLNWTLVNQHSQYYLLSISFANENSGVCVGSSGKILWTNNGGLNWSETSSGVSTALTSVSLSPDGTGLIAGEGGKIFRTINYGVNWVQQYTGNTYAFYTADNVNNTTGYACGDNGRVYKTTLAGANWNQIAEFGGIFKSSCFLNAEHGWIVGTTLYKTANGGATWDTLVRNLNGINSIDFANTSNGFMVGSGGLIFKTLNGGTSWGISLSPTINDLQSVYMFDENVAVACGAIGTVLWTENFGVGVQQISSQVPSNFKLHQNYPNPFNPSTRINFEILNAGFVQIKIFDIAGREIETLANQNFSPGEYVADWNAKNSPTGVYLYTLNFFSPSGEKKFTSTKKMMLVK
jgi:photosystem II stability/assembly factor-like uncharacterized protein